MSLTVSKIARSLIIDPDSGGEREQRKREKPAQKRAADSVSISDEARRRSAEEPAGEAEGW